MNQGEAGLVRGPLSTRCRHARPHYSGGMTRGWKIFRTVTCLVAACLFLWKFLNGWLEIVAPYGDGHGPDPGSREALMGSERRRHGAPRDAATAASYWLVFSAIVPGVVSVARSAVRLLGVEKG